MTIINPAKIYSTLGNSSSLIPLAVKDCASTAGMTAGSYITGKEEGQDRLIDELGTEIIWLCGIPCFKWIFDKTIFKFLKMDSKFDARNLQNKDILKKIQEYAPTEDIKKNIEKIVKNEKQFKSATVAKFIVSTGLTVASYFGLTKFKQKYTEGKIKQNLINEYKVKENQKLKDTEQLTQPSFKGIGRTIEYFAFNPVRNMWIIDGCITTQRLSSSRTPQEFWGYAIKEASILCFLYYAGGKIQELLEKNAKVKHNKNISLDARVLEDVNFQKAFENNSVKIGLEEFSKIKKVLKNGKIKKDAVCLYEFLNKNPENIVTKIAKQSNIISTYKDSNKIDTRKFIDLEAVESIEQKLSELYNQYLQAIRKGESSNKFFNNVKKLKRNSIIMNLSACITALGIVTPALMLLKRCLNQDDKEFATKKKVREQLIKEGVLV